MTKNADLYDCIPLLTVASADASGTQEGGGEKLFPADKALGNNSFL